MYSYVCVFRVLLKGFIHTYCTLQSPFFLLLSLSVILVMLLYTLRYSTVYCAHIDVVL